MPITKKAIQAAKDVFYLNADGSPCKAKGGGAFKLVRFKGGFAIEERTNGGMWRLWGTARTKRSAMREIKKSSS